MDSLRLKMAEVTPRSPVDIAVFSNGCGFGWVVCDFATYTILQIFVTYYSMQIQPRTSPPKLGKYGNIEHLGNIFKTKSEPQINCGGRRGRGAVRRARVGGRRARGAPRRARRRGPRGARRRGHHAAARAGPLPRAVPSPQFAAKMPSVSLERCESPEIL